MLSRNISLVITWRLNSQALPGPASLEDSFSLSGSGIALTMV
jgi:hypothetical protein